MHLHRFIMIGMRSTEGHPEDGEVIELGDAMLAFLEVLRQDPSQPVSCIFGDGAAIMVRDMNAGCVALPAVQVQALCQQHDFSRTPMDGDIAVVDLSVGAAWSAHRGIEPLYTIIEGELREFIK